MQQFIPISKNRKKRKLFEIIDINIIINNEIMKKKCTSLASGSEGAV